MEDENNSEKKSENEIKEDTNIYFMDFLLNNKNTPSILKESLSYQKKFTAFIISQLQATKQAIQNKENITILKNIFSFLINNYSNFGFSFFSLLIKEDEFIKDIIFVFYNKNVFQKEIKVLIQKLIEIFNFDFGEEISNPMEKYYKDFVDYGIIEQKNLNINISEKQSNLTEEQQLFIHIESLLFNLKQYKDFGNYDEIGSSEYFDNEIKMLEQKLKSLKLNNNISNAAIEYYQEKIEEIKNYKNIIKQEKEDDNNNEEDELEEETNEKEDSEDSDELLTFDEIMEEIKEFRKKPLKERIYFFKDEQIINDENEYTEFKNYYFPLGKVQKDELIRQFCSFLNSNGGRIYIGINDKRIIKGVVANERLTVYEKKMCDLMEDFCPKINVKEILDFYPIPVRSNRNGKIIDNLFVFKILIKRGDPSILYSTSSKGLHCSIRLQGQCANLTAEEIHRTILERNKLKKSPNYNYNNEIREEDYEMRDPCPYVCQRVMKNEQKKLLVKKFDKIDIKSSKSNNNNEKEKDTFVLIGSKNREKEKDDIFNSNRNCKTKKKNKNKNRNKNRKKFNNNIAIYRVEFSNIDKSVDENKLNELFGGYNYENFKFFKMENNQSNGYMDFLNEEDADDLIRNFNNMTLGNRLLHLNKISFI